VPPFDLESRRICIEQSKGLKDRVILIGQPVVEALRAWFAIRGDAGDDHVFLFRHKPLSVSYCGTRMRTYGKRCGVVVTPHQLRHSYATLMLNAGVPVEALQQSMGPQSIDTTLIYGHVHDRTVASAYYRAIRQVEGVPDQPANTDLLTLIDVLEAVY
jgi:integrase